MGNFTFSLQALILRTFVPQNLDQREFLAACSRFKWTALATPLGKTQLTWMYGISQRSSQKTPFSCICLFSSACKSAITWPRAEFTSCPAREALTQTRQLVEFYLSTRYTRISQMEVCWINGLLLSLAGPQMNTFSILFPHSFRELGKLSASSTLD